MAARRQQVVESMRNLAKNLLIAAIGAVVAGVVFSPLAHAPFLFDDLSVIQMDEPIAEVSAGLAPHVDLFRGLHGKPRPVRQFTHRLDAAMAGPQNALFAHCVNLALHCGVGILFWFLLHRLRVETAVSVAAMALFLFNPVCVESIGIVSHRKELLAALFSLLFLHSLLSSGSFAIPASIAAFFLAVFSKETAAIAPLLFFVVSAERRRTEGDGLKPDRKALPRFWIVSAIDVLLVVLVWRQIHFGMSAAGVAPGIVPNRPGHFVSGAPWNLVFSAVIRAFPRYLELLVVPLGHTIDPAFSLAIPLFSPSTAISAAVCLLCLAAAILLARSRSPWFAPAAWTLLSLSPYLFPPFVRGGHTAALADRYAYVAALGVSWGLAVAFVRLSRQTRLAVFRFAPFAAVAVFAICFHLQSRDYRSLESFWARAVRFNPNSPESRFNHAVSLWRERGDADSARREFERAIGMDPDNPISACGLSDLLLAGGEGDKALATVDSALARPSIRSVAPLLRKRAALLLALSRFSEALSAFRAAEAAGVDAPPFQRGFAEACKRNLLWPEAVARYRLAAISPAFRGVCERHRLLVENPPLATAAPLDVIVLGDSVPHGTGAVGPDGSEHSLAERLSAKSPGLKAKDASVPGSTAYGTNRDFLSLLPSTNVPARICVMMTGHNDAFEGRDPRGILFEISGCIFKARCAGMIPLVVGPIRVCSAGLRDRAGQEAILSRLDSLLESFCRETNVPFLSSRREIFAGRGVAPPLSFIDPATGNHLTDMGLDRLSESCLTTVSSLLEPKGKQP